MEPWPLDVHTIFYILSLALSCCDHVRSSSAVCHTQLLTDIRANGFGLTKAAGLPSYAEKFSSAGFACLLFDYRRWGLSGISQVLAVNQSELYLDGTCRNSFFVSEQLEDYRTVFNWARENPLFDSDRIVMWGFSIAGASIVLSSFLTSHLAAGGHVLALSAEVFYTLSIYVAHYLSHSLALKSKLPFLKPRTSSVLCLFMYKSTTLSYGFMVSWIFLNKPLVFRLHISPL